MSISRSAKTQIARSSAARSAFLARATVFFDEPGRRLEGLADLGLGQPLVEQRRGAVHLAQPSHDREDQAAGPLAVRLELLGEGKRGLQVAGHERVGEVVDLGRGVARGQVARRRRG